MIIKNVLSVTAHPDDEVLGFGGSAFQFLKKGINVTNCILSGSADARNNRPEIKELYEDTLKAQEILGGANLILGNFPNIKFNTVPHLELVQFIEHAIEKTQPDYIFTHHPSDLNNDHYHTSIACQAAARLFQRKKDIVNLKGLFFMEILSSTDWAFSGFGNEFRPNTFMEIGLDGVKTKTKALSAYRGVVRPFPHPRSEEILLSLATFRGGQAGINYAESFQTGFQLLS